MATRRTCCLVGCESLARWGLWWGNSPDDYTDSCEAHVCELLAGSPLVAVEDLGN